MAYIKNWRDQQPEVAHLSAIRWPGLRQRNATPKHGEDDSPQLHNIQGIVKHGLQGRKTSDHHKHPQTEQAYYIISGSGEVLVGEDRFSVRPCDAVYLPADIYHQMFNDMNDEWLEHLVLSKNIDTEPGGECVIRNWEGRITRKRWRRRNSLASTRPCRRRKYGLLKIHRFHRPRSRTTRSAEHCAMLRRHRTRLLDSRKQGHPRHIRQRTAHHRRRCGSRTPRHILSHHKSPQRMV